MRCGHTWLPRTKKPVQCPACHSSWWNRPRSAPRPREALSLHHPIFSLLNDLKKRRLIKDWVLYGALAYIYYEEVLLTRDADVLVTVYGKPGKLITPEYTAVLRELGARGRMVGEAATFELHGTPLHLQIFDATGHDQWEAMVADGLKTSIGEEQVKVASPEHLILMALQAYRPAKDMPRIPPLYRRASKKKLDQLLERFDRDGTLRSRLTRTLEVLG